jgi:hypothetical protein
MRTMKTWLPRVAQYKNRVVPFHFSDGHIGRQWMGHEMNQIALEFVTGVMES